MTYVEWLRVKRVLRLTLIVLAIFLLIGGVARIWVSRLTTDALTHFSSLEGDRGSTVTHTTLPDGSTQTVIDNPRKQAHVTIVDRGYQGLHIEAIEPHEGHDKPETVYAGTISVHQSLTDKNLALTVVDTNSATFFADYAIIALLVAFITATVLGAPFARESDGHLEIAATKPISREGFALASMGVDAAGIVAAYVIGILFAIALHSIFQAPHIVFATADAIAVGFGLMGSIAWYALLTAATASMRRGYGVLLGLSWPAAGLVFGLSYVQPSNAFATAIHWIFGLLNYLNPVRYMGPHIDIGSQGEPLIGGSASQDFIVLVVLIAIYGALAVVQWRRVEA